MKYRIASILAYEAANSAATKVIDLNVRKPISRITIKFKGTNNGSVPTAHPAKMISKIEIVDGSNVLFSLSGIQCQALNFYETGRMPTTVMEFRNDVMAIALYEINFGRFLWDRILAFDPSKFNNPQLKITHNKALGGSAPDAGALEVWAHIWDTQDAQPTGFLMSKEQFNYTLVASAIESIDLATDKPYRSLMIQSLTGGKQPWENYNKIKLTENNDAAVIINEQSTSSLIDMLKRYPNIVEYVHALDLDTSPTHYCTPTYETGIVGVGMATFNGSLRIAQSYGGTFTPTGDANEHVAFMITGKSPHGAMLLPFGKQDDIDDWYDVAGLGSLQLKITAGSGASGTCQIISQQVRNY